VTKVKHYLNLTNGIEAGPRLAIGEPWGFVRIQSTACEQKRWDFLIQDLDVDLLAHLAAGVRCVVWDFSQRKRVPRSLYHGIEWIRYACERRWFGKSIEATVRGNDCRDYFDRSYRAMDRRTKSKLDYHRRFLLCDATQLDIAPGMTAYDGQDAFYAGVLATLLGEPAGSITTMKG
jgi:hypothetical protein